MKALSGFAALAVLLVPAIGVAQAPPIIPRAELPGIGAVDPRRPVEVASAPWNALGRVQTELGTRCTGTLVAPRTVLTAAHCLVAPRTARLVQPGSVHVLLGYDRERWAARARVTGYRVGPGFSAAQRGPLEADWALLTLETALPSHVLPLLHRSPEAGQAAMLGGYQQDRPEVLLADTACTVLGTAARGDQVLLVHGCAGTRGASGAPLLVQRPDGGWAVAGLNVAAVRGTARGLAIPAAMISGE